ncbi:MAG: ROK family protein [Alphaproteobacteria bacterium]|nr:ROK family protein [Alphaproteobacteria bacterium]MDE2110745.1 ROK family protein [Alphaproteobacteria bacterium]MDE2494550.1 ROK family protein [Alphaproteobacteria bacterium]
MRLGIDLGGTKIEIMAVGEHGKELLRRRVPTPQDTYDETVRAIRDLVLDAEDKLGARGTVGIAIPGTISRKTGLVKNANSTRLIGHPLDKDLSQGLQRAVRVENDANCFTLSEAADGAAADVGNVFGIIVGTGVGGGVCVGGRILSGAHGIAGEWGHNPLPAQNPREIEDAPHCYCGKRGCIEAWCSGPALARLYKAHTRQALSVPDIVAAARRGDKPAADEMEMYYDRLARSIATVVGILDPDIVVMGGGLSNIDDLYTELQPRVERYAFTPEGPTRIVKNMHGDSSGVRGAAWLWREEEIPLALPK